ncbi:MAG: metallophosphoesterase [Elusimicrobia bacterium]|nr:metallophosphoesterase [Elusimicrobiota bacterium]
MKILVYTDVQACERSERCRLRPDVPLQRHRTAVFFAEMERLAREHNVGAVWDLGDTLVDRSEISVPTLQVTEAGLRWLMRGLPPALCYKLIGNHEQYEKATHTHAGGLFHPFFRVVPERAVFDWYDGPWIVALAFPYDLPAAELWLQEAIKAGQDCGRRVVVIGHAPVRGAGVPSGKLTAGLDPSCLDGADLALLGHVHRHQRIGERSWYVGSPFQQDFGEAADTKHVAILDTDTLAVDFPAMTAFPQYRVADVSAMPDDFDPGEDRWSVVVRSREEAQRLYGKPWAAKVEIEYVYERNQVRQEESVDLSPETLVRDYARLNQAPGLDAARLVDLGVSIVRGD